MEEIKNERMIAPNDCYADQLKFHDGFIVTRSFSPRSYLTKDRKESYAWLPEVTVYKPNNDVPVSVGGHCMVAKSPAEIYGFLFEPIWNGRPSDAKDIIFRFHKSFVPENEHGESIGDFVVNKHNLIGYYDCNNIELGRVSYSGIDNRDVTLHGSEEDLERMLVLATQNMPPRTYDLEFKAPCSVYSNKDYVFKVTPDDITKFAHRVVEEF